MIEECNILQANVVIFYEDERVERQLTIAYTPQQNGVVERMNQTL